MQHHRRIRWFGDRRILSSASAKAPLRGDERPIRRLSRIRVSVMIINVRPDDNLAGAVVDAECRRLFPAVVRCSRERLNN